jgi:subtilisin-like proprotein convertase family protein
MKFQNFFFTCLLAFFSISSAAAQVLSVTPASQPPYDDMVELIKNHLTGQGVEILDVQFGGQAASVGFFTDGNTAVGLKRGLVMSTGNVAATAGSPGIVGVGNEQASKNVNSTATSPQLQTLATATLYDVAKFTITFKTFSDSVQFRYVFASEEYPEYACSSFNDLFGFFLSGPNPSGGTYVDQNIALIPGTNLPVAINNLHPINNNSGTICPPINEQFYINNLNSSQQPVFDGLTHVFKAESAVIPCEVYQMTIAIADVGDGVYDSGVFLEAKSLSSSLAISASFDSGNAIIPENAIADTVFFAFSDIPADLLPMSMVLSGTATNGIDYQLIDSVTVIDSPNDTLYFFIQPLADSLIEEVESIQFVINASTGCLFQQFSLYIADPDSLTGPVDTIAYLGGNSVYLSVKPTSVSDKTWFFDNTNALSIEPSNTLIASSILVDLPFDTLSDILVIQSVCLNIDHAFVDDLDLFLKAPNGTFVELSTDNGANGDNYTNTCFSPLAAESIRGDQPFAPASAAPFSGTWQPEGDWNDIVGTQMKGAWELIAVDDAAGFVGTLKDWSITFSGADLGRFQYLWSTGETTASIQANAAGLYSVTVSNELGSFSQTFVVTDESVATEAPVTAADAFQISPNPADGGIHVIPNPALHLQMLKIYDLQGTLMLEQSQTGHIDNLGDLPAGVYVVVLECSEGHFTKKLIRR